MHLCRTSFSKSLTTTITTLPFSVRLYFDLFAFSFLGSYALHTDPKSEAILCVSQSVSMFEDEKTRDRSPRVFIIWQVDWVVVIPSCFVGHFCFQCVLVVV